MNIELKGKIALVIGGMGEIGSAICKQLALSGAVVTTNYRSETELEEWHTKQSCDNPLIKAYRADVTDFNSCSSLVKRIEAELGPINIVIHSQDFINEIPLENMAKQQWDRMLSLNLDSLFNVCKNVAEGMAERGFGRIITISSMIFRMGRSGHSHFAAAKASMHGFNMTLAQELGRKGITVNTVSPGQIRTSQLPRDNGQQSIHAIPAGRQGEAEEVACLVNFLCSDKAGFINGADIAINGGQYVH